ncbi:hypothetical protein SAMN05428947_10891 [Mucilaginibacter sp. OK283]|nr:hypothetical protein SAMN05428947_10891 [Mucilaginibacter sp. OK283]
MCGIGHMLKKIWLSPINYIHLFSNTWTYNHDTGKGDGDYPINFCGVYRSLKGCNGDPAIRYNHIKSMAAIIAAMGNQITDFKYFISVRKLLLHKV